MKTDKEKICNYCKKPPKEQVGDNPAWFGRYQGEKIKMVICIDCIKENRDKWRKGEV